MGCIQSSSKGAKCGPSIAGAESTSDGQSGLRTTARQLFERIIGCPMAEEASEKSGNNGERASTERQHCLALETVEEDVGPELRSRLEGATRALESEELPEIIEGLLDNIAKESSQVRFQDILDLVCAESSLPLSRAQPRPASDLVRVANILRMRSEAGARSNRARSAERPEAGGRTDANQVQLFTSAQQLCSQIINKSLSAKLKASAVNKKAEDNRAGDENVLCLFVFGRQGSSRGELIFELLEHSALARALSEDETEPDGAGLCPLYHHIDVASVIVANLSDRISEYHQLRAGIEEARRASQLALEEAELEPGRELGEDEQRTSLSSQMSLEEPAELADVAPASAEGVTDQLELINLSTKHRSIIQMKLMRFSNCVTSKWVFGLIRNEVARMELRASRSAKGLTSRARVYLINLVPNQLSLFKSCLYLRQNLDLKELQYRYWALRFERRTNIKLLRKERMKPDSDRVHHSSVLRLTNLVPPSLGLLMSSGKSASSTANGLASRSDATPRGARVGAADGRAEAREQIRALAASAIMNSLNEKLGPKFQDHFAQQFKSAGRLTEVRYNPLTDYNYASMSDQLSFLSTTSCLSAPCRRPASNLQRPCSANPSCLSPEVQAGNQQARLSMSEPLDESSRLSTSLAHLSPSCSFSSIETCEISSAEPGSPTSHSLASPRRPLVKWAVELELCWRTSARQQLANGPSQGRVDACSAVFREPRSLSILRSRSPVLFRTQLGSAGPIQYQLVTVRVAYATGNTNTLHEIKRVHQHSYKLKSLEGLDGLLKLIEKARRRVEYDCKTWLNEAVLARQNELNCRTSARKRAAIVSPSRAVGLDLLASLIVYTIPVDVSRLEETQPTSSLRQQPERGPLIPILVLNLGEHPDEPRPKRHVHFRLEPAPPSSSAPSSSRASEQDKAERAPVSAGEVQRRQWLDSSLFVSVNLEQASGSVMQLMPILASVVQSSLANKLADG